MNDETLGYGGFGEWYKAQPYSARSCWEAYKAGFERALSQLSEDLADDLRKEFNSKLRRDVGRGVLGGAMREIEQWHRRAAREISEQRTYRDYGQAVESIAKIIASHAPDASAKGEGAREFLKKWAWDHNYNWPNDDPAGRTYNGAHVVEMLEAFASLSPDASVPDKGGARKASGVD